MDLESKPAETISSPVQPGRFARRLKRSLMLLATVGLLFTVGRTPAPALAGGLRSEADQLAEAAKIVGPDGNNDNACSKCHIVENNAWQNTHHYSTFKERHQSPEAKAILEKMKFRSMKRQGECLQCHYTSVVDSGKLVPTWGVSCESCHGPAADWVTIHNKPGGNPAAKALAWGTGKNEPPAQKEARLKAAEAKGMISSQMIYEIATNCFSCHTVPDETLVNKGGHKAGSDFDLVAWSQGEVRHNFADSPGAPNHPTNRPATAAQLRRLYVVGAAVDLQFTLKNLAIVKEKGGVFDKAMVERANRIRAKVAAILAAAPIPELADALKAVPAKIDATTVLPAGLPETLAAATKKFAATNDGSKLAAIDPLIPKVYMGKVTP
ncbi:MAG TPA: multiheme c-type cytochrome [Tepidisphaeraceae bacterium]|jgi:hypothetical protein|nr:multiheme c-type cytochrome [Tepidisphaeraceae bacterium]